MSKNRQFYAVTTLFLTGKYRTHFICHLRKILQNFMKNFWRYAGFSKILHWLQWQKSNFSNPCDSQEVLERGYNTFFMNFSCYQKYLQQLTRNFMKNFGIWIHSDFPLKTKKNTPCQLTYAAYQLVQSLCIYMLVSCVVP